MKILILGGTVFLGPHVIDAALSVGHSVAVFNRGTKPFPTFMGIEQFIGDRTHDADLLQLSDRYLDVVIDTCGYEPTIVEKSAQFFRERTSKYVFISSISAIENFREAGITESANLKQLPDSGPGDYGQLKAACEKVVQLYSEYSVLIIRPGLIVGPLDPTDRFTYWVHRAKQGGTVLAPDVPGYEIQVIDVRDLAEWIIHCIEKEIAGVFNATGPDYALTFGKFLDECKLVLSSDAEFVWVNGQFLLDKEIKPWSQIPLWLPASDLDHQFMFKLDCSKAMKAGLKFRSINSTILDTAAWHQTRALEGELASGLPPQLEEEILSQYH